ncbi:MAG TPA: DUF937 domain-containing protein [Campylobacterales bacterium]|nr:DUF937 domain-containing protein [Campylobacterales bacterium]
MDLSTILNMGASLIQNNSDDATTGLDSDALTGALGNLIGGENGIDLSNIMSGLSENGLSEVVSSWLGNGENLPISAESITDLLGADKVSEFAQNLGISEESAQGAIADALPNLVDQATSGENSIVDDLLSQVGGVNGAMEMIGKMFR